MQVFFHIITEIFRYIMNLPAQRSLHVFQQVTHSPQSLAHGTFPALLLRHDHHTNTGTYHQAQADAFNKIHFAHGLLPPLNSFVIIMYKSEQYMV